jgi:alpha-galactosidase
MGMERLSLLKIIVTGNNDLFRVTTSLDEECEGVHYLNIEVEGIKEELPPEIKIILVHPSIGLFGTWRPVGNDMEDGYNRTLSVNWDGDDGKRISNTLSAPVVCLYDASGNNRLTVAYSDLLDPIYLKSAIHEETVELHTTLTLFKDTTLRFDRYSHRLRIDTRDISYAETLNAVSDWWSKAAGLAYAAVPSAARKPMYSTWYSFHQILTADDIEAQCRLAKTIGCETVIVDDGWQLSGADYGYNHTGDWEISVDKFIDIKKHVHRIHEAGLKYMLWYSVPFIGDRSNLWEQFKDKLLYIWESKGAGILDPRFPEVRAYIISQYEKAVKEWNMDGLKLDFVDYFNVKSGTSILCGNGRDFDDIQTAVDCLLSDVINRLKMIKQDIMIEFRQPYCGPMMRKYGNMLRAWDCVNDALENRVRTIDIRLISGRTAVHSDMIIWHKDDTVECAALQLLNIMFSVPQISLLLDKLPEIHLRMLKFWLSFMRNHEDVLQEGVLTPAAPHLLYPTVTAVNEDKKVIAVYDDRVVRLKLNESKQIFIVNGKLTNEIIAEIEDEGRYSIAVYTCEGINVREEEVEFKQGIYRYTVPVSGLLELTRLS